MKRSKHFLSVRFAGAFTLVEVLIVVVIILMLAAVLVIITKKNIESANGARCISSLRQVGIFSNLYSTENSGRLASIDYWRANSAGASREWRTWFTELQPYFNGKTPGEDVLRCPSTQCGQTYSMNMHLSGLHVSQISKPSQTVFLVEDTGGGWTSIRSSEAAPRGANPIQHRHNGKANFLFIDGNVSPMTYKETVSPKNLWDSAE